MGDPSLVELLERAEQLAVSGPSDVAERVNLEIIALDPENLAALRRLGKISKDRGDSDAAITYFRRTLELAPADTIAKSQLERLQGGPIRSTPRGIELPAIQKLMETISAKATFSEPLPRGPMAVRWPRALNDEEGRGTEVEEYLSGWDVTATLAGRTHPICHMLGYRVAYGRLRRRSLTLVHGIAEAEGVEADDYARTKGLLSVLRNPDRSYVRSKAEVPSGYSGFLQVWQHEEILAQGVSQSVAIKLLEDDVLGWACHALLRAAGRGRLDQGM